MKWPVMKASARPSTASLNGPVGLSRRSPTTSTYRTSRSEAMDKCPPPRIGVRRWPGCGLTLRSAAFPHGSQPTARRRMGPACGYSKPVPTGSRDVEHSERRRIHRVCSGVAESVDAHLAGGFDVLSRAIAELNNYLDRHDDTARTVVGRAADRLEGSTDQPADPVRWEQFVPRASRTATE